jgi:hypothetical protein
MQGSRPGALEAPVRGPRVAFGDLFRDTETRRETTDGRCRVEQENESSKGGPLTGAPDALGFVPFVVAAALVVMAVLAI